MDSKHHSTSNLLARADSLRWRRGGPDAFNAISPRKDLAALAATIPLPSSPIDVPGKAPSLSLDLGSSQLMSPTMQKEFEQERQDSLIKSEGCMSSLPPPMPLEHLPSSNENILPDPLQPTAEVRRSLLTPDQQRFTECQGDLRLSFDIDSPLPGTNAHIELDDTSAQVGEVKEPEIPSSPHALSVRPLVIDTVAALLATTDTSCTPSEYRSSKLLNASDRPYHHSATSQAHNNDSEFVSLSTAKPGKHPQDTGSTHTAKHLQDTGSDVTTGSLMSLHKIENHGPPSPERYIRLPIRSKVSFDSYAPQTRSRTDSVRGSSPDVIPPGLTKSRSRASLGQSFTPPRKQSIPDSAAILRERTGDHQQYLDEMNAFFIAERTKLETSPKKSSDRSELGTPSSTDRNAALPVLDRTPTSMASGVVFDDNLSETQTSMRHARYHVLQSSSPHTSSPSRFSPARYRARDNGSTTANSSSSNTPLRHDIIHNRFSLLADSDDMLSDEEDDDI